METVAFECERSILDNFIKAKEMLDAAKGRYDSARNKLLDVASNHCEYSSLRKVAASYVAGKCTVVIEPRLKFSIFDHEKMPAFIKPYIKVVESVTLSPHGKHELDKYLTDTYGSVDYNHPQTADFFGTLGVKSVVTLAASVKCN